VEAEIAATIHQTARTCADALDPILADLRTQQEELDDEREMKMAALIEKAEMSAALAASEAARQQGERIFEAVVHEYEGDVVMVPDDLSEASFVRRARAFRLKYDRIFAEQVAARQQAEQQMPRCNVCDQPIAHELVCEDCLPTRGFISAAEVGVAASRRRGS
jgi:hypothetical protein